MIVVVMGVAGAGKTVVGTALAQALGWTFSDADEFHSAANVAKMEQGIALTDEDRAPWLAAMHEALAAWSRSGQGGVLACSALKHAYRDLLAQGVADVRFVYLKASRALLEERLKGRQGHFMKVGMLASQLEALQEPNAEDALILDASVSITELVVLIRQHFGL